MLAGDRDEGVDIQIRLDRLAPERRTDEKGLVRLEPMERKPILVAVDGNGAEAELRGRAKTARCPLAEWAGYWSDKLRAAGCG